MGTTENKIEAKNKIRVIYQWYPTTLNDINILYDINKDVKADKIINKIPKKDLIISPY